MLKWVGLAQVYQKIRCCKCCDGWVKRLLCFLVLRKFRKGKDEPAQPAEPADDIGTSQQQ